MRLLALAVSFFIALAALPAAAVEYEVRMLDKGPGGAFVFEPGLVKLNAGDSIHFIAADKNHQVGNIRNMIPAGATPFLSRRNEDLTVTFTVPGVYAYDCFTHHSLGMVGLIVVGNNTSNLAQIKAGEIDPIAKQRFDAMIRQIEAGR